MLLSNASLHLFLYHRSCVGDLGRTSKILHRISDMLLYSTTVISPSYAHIHDQVKLFLLPCNDAPRRTKPCGYFVSC